MRLYPNGKLSQKSAKKAHVGKVFEICVEKGSELPEGDKLRRFKGRTVFHGNNVRDENADVALFSELGSSPATMEAGKAVDAYGAHPGYITQHNDGVQAYNQALMQGVERWVELPSHRWPKEWHGKFTRPVVLLRIALCGHPDSRGALPSQVAIDRFCNARPGRVAIRFLSSRAETASGSLRWWLQDVGAQRKHAQGMEPDCFQDRHGQISWLRPPSFA